MVVGIDKGKRSRFYADAAKKMNIPFKLVDCTSSNIMNDLKDVDALIWHWTQDCYIDKRIAYHVIKSAELMGKKVYPDSDTCWMFDDKISEKYLLEAVGAPCVESKVFFSEAHALGWIRKQKFPIVYKLSQGAGSSNVRLIESEKDAKKICRTHFSFLGRPEINMKIYNSKKDMHGKILQEILQDSLIRYGVNNRGFILLQKFVPGNQYDIRVTMIGERGIIFRRRVRDNDFRASGSGNIDYNVSEQDIQAVPIARRISRLINSQTMTYDFVYDRGELKIIEMSYGFSAKAVYAAQGWYDENMLYHLGHTDVHEMILRQMMEE